MSDLKTIIACLLRRKSATNVHAAGQTIDNVTITSVAVNGGADTANPGTACIKRRNPVATACTDGCVALASNNRSLLAAALLRKQAGSSVWVMYYLPHLNSIAPGSCSGVRREFHRLHVAEGTGVARHFRTVVATAPILAWPRKELGDGFHLLLPLWNSRRAMHSGNLTPKQLSRSNWQLHG